MSFSESDKRYMELALEQAKLAAEVGDVPVGAVIVDGEGNILSANRNKREERRSAIAHAEILCISEACEKRNTWRLADCTMYVTLEPCPMCAGALINSRIKRVVCGSKNPKAGALGSVIDLDSYPLNHKCRAEYGLLGKECASALSDFFENKRCDDVEKINKP